jgi:hypothetical protein
MAVADDEVNQLEPNPGRPCYFAGESSPPRLIWWMYQEPAWRVRILADVVPQEQTDDGYDRDRYLQEQGVADGALTLSFGCGEVVHSSGVGSFDCLPEGGGLPRPGVVGALQNPIG